MSTTVNYGWLKDKSGNKIAPKTLSSQIITNEGKSFEEHIQEQLSSAGSTDGIVVNVEIANWVAQSDGTYKNTITVNGISSSDVYDVNLYEDYSEEQAMAFDFLVTSIDTENNKVILTASEKINIAFSIILRGKVNLEDKNVYVSDLSATSIEYDNTKSNLDSTNMQNAMDEIATMVNGLVVNVSTDGWDIQEDGTYRKIIPLEQITGKETLDVCLYPGDIHTNEQIIAFSELITSIETGEGRITLTAVEEITVSFRIFLYGKINFDKNNLVVLDDNVMEVKEISQEEYDNLSQSEKESGVYITDGDDITAKDLEYDGSKTGLGANAQDAIDNLNKNLTSFTSGMWTIRKYSDGTTECYGVYELANGDFAEAGNLFYRSASNIALPTDLFIEKPVITVSCECNSVHGSGLFNVTNTSFGVSIISPADVSRAVTMNIHAYGKWK